jgi:hypothetical protein
MTFSFGIAIVTKYYDFAEWIGKAPWIAFPMIVLGALGIILLWGKED